MYKMSLTSCDMKCICFYQGRHKLLICFSRWSGDTASTSPLTKSVQTMVLGNCTRICWTSNTCIKRERSKMTTTPLMYTICLPPPPFLAVCGRLKKSTYLLREILLCDAADMSAVLHSRHVCCPTQHTCLLCDTAQMSAACQSRHACCVTQQTCVLRVIHRTCALSV